MKTNEAELRVIKCAECGGEIKRDQRRKIRFMKDRKRSIRQTIHHKCDRPINYEPIYCLVCRKAIARLKGGRKRIYTDRYDAGTGLEVSGFIHLKCARPSDIAR